MALGNAHHLGRIGAWAEMAARAGLVSLHFVNVIARSVVAPYGGADARFGTNPFTAGVPLPGRDPLILDFATSAIAQGKTRVAHNKGELVAEGCLLDDHGEPTRSPRYSVIEPFGALLTFGAHKGYGMAVLCELLGGALAAGLALHSHDASKRRVLNGMLTVLIDPAAIADRDSYEREALAFVDWVRASPPCASPASPSSKRARAAASKAFRSMRRPGRKSSTAPPSWASMSIKCSARPGSLDRHAEHRLRIAR
jgi:uncharacterized oxidoreductase